MSINRTVEKQFIIYHTTQQHKKPTTEIAMWMNLKTMLSERKRTHKRTYYIIPSLLNSRKEKSYI